MNAPPPPADPLPADPPSASSAAADALRDQLLACGFTPAGLRERLPWLAVVEELWTSPRRFHLPPPADPLDRLVRLLLLGEPTPAAALAERLPPSWAAAAEALQLLSVEKDMLVPRCALIPWREGWLRCGFPADPTRAAPPGAALAAWPPTACDLWLLYGLDERRVERALAVGDAAGLFAPDLSRHADSVEAWCGSSAEAAAIHADSLLHGRANVHPTFSADRAGPTVQRIAGRSSIVGATAQGEAFPAKAFVERSAAERVTLLNLVAARLAEGGEALLSVEWAVGGANSGPADLSAWASSAGLAGVFFRAKSEEAAAWTAERLRSVQHVAPAEYARRLNATLLAWEEAGVERIETGVLCLRRGYGTWFRVDHVEDPRHVAWAAARERVFVQQEQLHREWRLDTVDGRKRLLATYFRTLPSVAADQTVLFHEGRWHVTGASAAYLEGLGYTGKMDFLLLQTLPLLNGKRPLGDVVDKLFRVLNVPREQAEPLLLKNLEQLIARGMVEPVAPEPPAPLGAPPGAFTAT